MPSAGTRIVLVIGSSASAAKRVLPRAGRRHWAAEEGRMGHGVVLERAVLLSLLGSSQRRAIAMNPLSTVLWQA